MVDLTPKASPSLQWLDRIGNEAGPRRFQYVAMGYLGRDAYFRCSGPTGRHRMSHEIEALEHWLNGKGS